MVRDAVKGATVAAVLLLVAAGWYAWRRQGQDAGGDLVEWGDWAEWSPGSLADDVVSAADSVLGSGLDVIDDLTGGFVKVSRMRDVSAADLDNANVQAMLGVIRAGEGTADANGYRRIFGGQLFSSYADHPRVTVKKSGYTSSAAGAYQAIASTWDETKAMMGLPDFSPASQDLFAVGRIAARGALADVKAGRFEAAVKKIAREWASLPGSPYGQPVISMERAKSVYVAWGGGFGLPEGVA